MPTTNNAKSFRQSEVTSDDLPAGRKAGREIPRLSARSTDKQPIINQSRIQQISPHFARRNDRLCQPTTNNQQPTTNNYQRKTINHQPSTNHQPPTTINYQRKPTNIVFQNNPNVKKWTVDQEDIDNVLRIEASQELSISQVIGLVSNAGFHCEELT